MNWKLVCAVAVVCLSGCIFSSGFNRNLLESRLRDDGFKVADDDIKAIQARQSQLQFPCRIAIATRTSCYSDSRWTPKDRQAMEAWAAALREAGIASEVTFMSSLFASGETLKELRASAATYGADTLLVIKGTSATESRMNPLAMLNLTVVGGFLAPGSHRDALFRIEGGLVDVNNGYLYASMEAEGEGSTLGPTFIIEDKGAIEEAKQSAMKCFGPELLGRLRSLRASAVPVASAPRQPESSARASTNEAALPPIKKITGRP